MTHTPGPWRVGELPPAGWRYILRSDDHTEVAAVAEWAEDGDLHIQFQGDRAIANAHLIAAAPELLEALEDLEDLAVAIFQGDYQYEGLDEGPELQAARLAIAKAKGEEQ